MYADLIVMAALDVGNCKFKEEPEKYLKAVYPNDPPEKVRGEANGYPNAKPKPIPPQSCCGLFFAGCLCAAGVEHPPLYRPYHGRSDIMTVLDVMARMHGAACSPSKNDNNPFGNDGEEGSLSAGCGLYIGRGMTAHMIAVTAVERTADPYTVKVRTVEGGQGAGNEIAEKERILRYHPTTGVISVVGDIFNRSVNYWIDPGKLPLWPKAERSGRRSPRASS